MEKNKVTNIIELKNLLGKKYGNRLSVEFKVDPYNNGSIEGFLDGSPFLITFTDKFLLATAFNGNVKLLDKLAPTLKKAIGNEEPICSYDIKCDGLLNPTIEWDVKDPKKRLKDVVNGRAFELFEICNLKLYGSEKIEDYLENSDDKNIKVYGIYPGTIKSTEEIDVLNEFELFINIEGLGGHIWWCNHQMSHGRIEPIDLTEEQYALEYLVYQTTKFGVELSPPTPGKHVDNSPSYRAWYQFWYNHYKTLSNVDFVEYQVARNNGADISKFMPKGSWKDLLDTPGDKEDKPVQKIKTPNNSNNS